MDRSGSDIPAAELEVLAALWRAGDGTVRDVQADLERHGRELAYNTVQTLLSRLEERGYVRARRGRRAHLYQPRISRESVLADRLGTLVRQLGEGEATPLILQLVQAHKLSADDIRQLRELLGQLESEE
jgi:predicted transcriptional regulator